MAPKVEFFNKPGCPRSAELKKRIIMDSDNVDLSFYNLDDEANKQKLSNIMAKRGVAKFSTPVVVIDGQVHADFDISLWVDNVWADVISGGGSGGMPAGGVAPLAPVASSTVASPAPVVAAVDTTSIKVFAKRNCGRSAEVLEALGEAGIAANVYYTEESANAAAMWKVLESAGVKGLDTVTLPVVQLQGRLHYNFDLDDFIVDVISPLRPVKRGIQVFFQSQNNLLERIVKAARETGVQPELYKVDNEANKRAMWRRVREKDRKLREISMPVVVIDSSCFVNFDPDTLIARISSGNPQNTSALPPALGYKNTTAQPHLLPAAGLPSDHTPPPAAARGGGPVGTTPDYPLGSGAPAAVAGGSEAMAPAMVPAPAQHSTTATPMEAPINPGGLQVEMFIKESCGKCQAVMEAFADRGIKVGVYDVGRHPSNREHMWASLSKHNSSIQQIEMPVVKIIRPERKDMYVNFPLDRFIREVIGPLGQTIYEQEQDVKVFTKDGCTRCDAVRGALRNAGLQFTVFRTEEPVNEEGMWRRVRSAFPGQQSLKVSMPVVSARGKVYANFELEDFIRNDIPKM
uniref:Glutaredoxin domain-containing protein n=1 Tax=Chromera velia CCMP2878 TaxID=1169474 RepID=A0A0G4EZG2_9ALVE|eukprot:Cvel_14396.t1-p1 / transcript=Cvel_14396.t1 / gene=Cvel_14396 / organism=Chromera_velia_CCMP2878 / gene_product=hypothetical protein / transcript_product=hypothetical protein / location=Cvel_scaffold1022:29763-32125(-) / protein_length=573 / sequence_SO=supercontig / SO=protein_coding / is_pseudo=false